MTKAERINILRVKAAIKTAIDDLKRGTKDFDCCWPNGTIKSLQVCMQLLNEIKV